MSNLKNYVALYEQYFDTEGMEEAQIRVHALLEAFAVMNTLLNQRGTPLELPKETNLRYFKAAAQLFYKNPDVLKFEETDTPYGTKLLTITEGNKDAAQTFNDSFSENDLVSSFMDEAESIASQEGRTAEKEYLFNMPKLWAHERQETTTPDGNLIPPQERAVHILADYGSDIALESYRGGNNALTNTLNMLFAKHHENPQAERIEVVRTGNPHLAWSQAINLAEIAPRRAILTRAVKPQGGPREIKISVDREYIERMQSLTRTLNKALGLEGAEADAANVLTTSTLEPYKRAIANDRGYKFLSFLLDKDRFGKTGYTIHPSFEPSSVVAEFQPGEEYSPWFKRRRPEGDQFRGGLGFGMDTPPTGNIEIKTPHREDISYLLQMMPDYAKDHPECFNRDRGIATLTPKALEELGGFFARLRSSTLSKAIDIYINMDPNRTPFIPKPLPLPPAPPREPSPEEKELAGMRSQLQEMRDVVRVFDTLNMPNPDGKIISGNTENVVCKFAYTPDKHSNKLVNTAREKADSLCRLIDTFYAESDDSSKRPKLNPMDETSKDGKTYYSVTIPEEKLEHITLLSIDGMRAALKAFDQMADPKNLEAAREKLAEAQKLLAKYVAPESQVSTEGATRIPLKAQLAQLKTALGVNA